MTHYVGYHVDTSDGELPYARVTIRGMAGKGDGTYAVIAHGAVPWHASAEMRKVAAELLEVADALDRDYPRDAPRMRPEDGSSESSRRSERPE